MDDASLVEYLARAKAGDQSAVNELVISYEPVIRVMVRGKLPRVLRSRFDTSDFLQLVLKSVFAKSGAHLDQFQNEQRFVGYLRGVVRNKIFYELRRLSERLKYDIGREQPLYVRKGNREIPQEIPGKDSTPSAEAQADDRLAQILQGRGEFSTEVVQLRRLGLTYEEVAERLGVHESLARRVIQEMRKRMETRGWG